MSRFSELVLLLLLLAGALAGQPPPPGRGPGPGPGPPGGLDGVRRKLAEVRSTGPATDKLLSLARAYLERSERKENRNEFASNRYLAAADALVHAAEHQQHIAGKTGPPPPDKSEIARHLERVYFRLQQADYFVQQSGGANAAAIAGFAREYYQKALRANDRPDPRIADECAKSVDDLMRALENLAQAAVPEPVPPKPPHPKSR